MELLALLGLTLVVILALSLLVMWLVSAPWQILLLFLVLSLLVIQWFVTALVQKNTQKLQATETGNLEEDTQDVLSYRGVSYHKSNQPNQKEVTGKYRGGTWKSSNIVQPTNSQPKFEKKYRGVKVN
jgi:membrane protein implicated in regulation of membrane protease activity